MLAELTIQAYGLIDSIHLEFGPGLTVLTGETGAGKSMIIDALTTLLGGRALSENVRQGADKAFLQASFRLGNNQRISTLLEENGLPDWGEEIVIARSISRQGRNRSWVNQAVASVSLLKQIGALLLEIHGQHEHHSLLSPQQHLEVLDSYAGEELLAKRNKVSQAYRRLVEIDEQLGCLTGENRLLQRELDLLRFQVREIEKAGLSPGEEETLEKDLMVLSNAEKLYEETGRCYQTLYGDDQGGIAEELGGVLSSLQNLRVIDSRLDEIVTMLEEAQIQIQEAAHELLSYHESVDVNPQRLRQVEERLALLSRLKRKYGDTVEEVLQYASECRGRIMEIEVGEETAEQLREERKRLVELLEVECDELSQLRRQVANRLEKAVAHNLRDLNMGSCRFVVQVTPLAKGGSELPFGRVNSRGADSVEFLLSTNKGEEPKALTRVASGGELSRVMLAFKALLAEVDDIPTVIFDEVDAGIGGRTIGRVAAKLGDLAEHRQIICITHWPQIAAAATSHYAISKSEVDGSVRVAVSALTGQERIVEIGRMLGSSVSGDAVWAHARELLSKARRQSQ